ncbi:MAG: hypothetical protein ACP5IL_17480 [Syntrophobacteraceae bacterium]
MKKRVGRVILVTILTVFCFALEGAATAQAMSTPTVSEFLNAANAVYLINATPAGMTRFTYNGKAASMVDPVNGAVSYVYITAEHQIIIAYQGTTGGLNMFWDPLGAMSQVLTDVEIVFSDDLSGTNPPAFGTALNFAKWVIAAAQSEGYSTSNIFVTGHSLGGIEAEYVASQTGLAGIGFESTGIAAKPAAGATGTNFVNTVGYGDPVANFASDVHAEQPCAPPYVAGGGRAPHYGYIAYLGSPSDETSLQNYALGLTWWKLGLDPWPFIELMAEFHLPGVQAHDLNVALNPRNSLVDGVGNMSGEVVSVGNLQIPAFISEMSGAGRLTKG